MDYLRQLSFSRRARRIACSPAIGLGLVAWALAPTIGLGAERKSPPNVVLILADDLGFSDLGCFGSDISTPTLDRLAADGLRFSQMYNTSRCWPTRASLLTGYYAQQVRRDPPGVRPKWAALLPRLLEPAGYHSYHSGKWHVDGPVLAGGFERSYLLEDTDRYFGPRKHSLDDAPLPPATGEFYSTTAIVDRALDWLDFHQREHSDSPFFLYVAFTCPHFPLQAPAEDVARYRGKYREGWDALRARRWERATRLGVARCALSERSPEAPAWNSLAEAEQVAADARMAVHAAMVDRMDREIARLLARLRDQGRFDDSVIIFLSDNGASAEKLVRGDGNDPSAPPGSAKTFLCLEPPWANLCNAPLRKSKMFTHEGGISTPMIVHWPKGIADRGAWRRSPAHVVDVAPTLLDLAGLEPPAEWNGARRPAFAGRSLKPAFENDVTVERDCLFFKHQGNRGLRVGDWKIASTGPKGAWELYDLANDRSETNDLSQRHPEKVAELAEIWRQKDEQFHKQSAE